MIGSDTALGSLPHWCLGLAKQSQNFAFESNRQMLDIHAFLYDAWFSPFCHFHFYHEGHGHGLLTQPWCCVGWLGFSSPTVHIFCLSLFSSPTDLPLWTFWFLFYFHHPCHGLSSGPGPPCSLGPTPPPSVVHCLIPTFISIFLFTFSIVLYAIISDDTSRTLGRPSFNVKPTSAWKFCPPLLFFFIEIINHYSVRLWGFNPTSC